MKTILVHGYAGETKMSVFRSYLDETAGFDVFRKEVGEGRALSFPWGLQTDLSFFQSLNPVSYLQIYQQELVMVHSRYLQEDMYRLLEEQNATTVIGHSMGSRLIFETAKSLGLPKSVKRVIWVQSELLSDVDVKDLFPDLVNVYCPWDPTLIAACLFVHPYFRAGLRPIARANNQLIPLWRLPNLHTSSQRSKQLLKWVV